MVRVSLSMFWGFLKLMTFSCLLTRGLGVLVDTFWISLFPWQWPCAQTSPDRIQYWEVPDQGRVCNNQIEGKASGVCWDINVLGEVEAVQQMGKLGDTVGGLGVNKNVECWVLTRMILLLVVKRLWSSGMKDGFARPVDKKYRCGKRRFTFEYLAFKLVENIQGYTIQYNTIDPVDRLKQFWCIIRPPPWPMVRALLMSTSVITHPSTSATVSRRLERTY